MMSDSRQAVFPLIEEEWLLATARNIASAFKLRATGTQLRIRVPSRCTATNTDGWAAVIGDLGKGQPLLEIWLDRFSGHDDRQLSAWFHAEERSDITAIVDRMSAQLWPVRRVDVGDIDRESHLVLNKRLARAEFNAPLLVENGEFQSFYGIYDLASHASAKGTANFCNRATAFFEDVARELPAGAVAEEQLEVYPRIENRKVVASHLRRERSRLLATECKIRDNYQCQVCEMRFESVFGILGAEFAESHHIIPLSKLKENVATRLEDLATVCANCHRMLHRMDGTENDIPKLRAIIQESAKANQPKVTT